MEIPSFWIGRINIIKMTILTKAVYRFSAIHIKLPRTFFTELEQNILVCLEAQKTQNSQRHPEKEKWSWTNQAPRLQTTLQSNSRQNRMVLHKARNLDQWNRIESPELNPHAYSQLIYGNRSENIQ